jgi:hypothetical protein
MRNRKVKNKKEKERGITEEKGEEEELEGVDLLPRKTNFVKDLNS